jgi:hypothetical protein
MISEETKAASRRMPGGCAEGASSPQKTSGMHCCIPERSKLMWKKLTSSSWLSSSLPFYSPLQSLNFAPALLAERVFSHHV